MRVRPNKASMAKKRPPVNQPKAFDFNVFVISKGDYLFFEIDMAVVLDGEQADHHRQGSDTDRIP